MKRQFQSYHLLLTLTGVVFAMTFTACGARETNATDTKTNWLLACDEDSDCSDSLACLCGVCSSTCDTATDCSRFDGEARCLDASHCSKGAAAVCAMSEGDLNPAHDDAVREAGAPASSSLAATSMPSSASSLDPTTASASGATSEEDATSSGGNSTSSCRDESLYITLGETCRVDFDCTPGAVPFFDDCGCGCEPNPACDPDRDYVAYGVTCDLADIVCEASEEYFRDACGCGCAPVSEVDGGSANFCPPPPPEGTSVDVTVLAETICFGDTSSQLVTSQEELDAALPYCRVVLDEVSFEGNVVYVGVFPERTAARFNYAVQTNGTIYLGLESDAYCGGAAPPDAVVVLQFAGASGNTPVIEDLCTLGECSGLPVP